MTSSLFCLQRRPYIPMHYVNVSQSLTKPYSIPMSYNCLWALMSDCCCCCCRRRRRCRTCCCRRGCRRGRAGSATAASGSASSPGSCLECGSISLLLIFPVPKRDLVALHLLLHCNVFDLKNETSWVIVIYLFSFHFYLLTLAASSSNLNPPTPSNFSRLMDPFQRTQRPFTIRGASKWT